jgi:hypothetical protein
MGIAAFSVVTVMRPSTLAIPLCARQEAARRERPVFRSKHQDSCARLLMYLLPTSTLELSNPKAIEERKHKTTNHPQGNPKLEPREQKQSDNITRQFMCRRSSQPEKYKEPDSQTREATTDTEEE